MEGRGDLGDDSLRVAVDLRCREAEDPADLRAALEIVESADVLGVRFTGAVKGVALDLYYEALGPEEEVRAEAAAIRCAEGRLCLGVESGVVDQEAGDRFGGGAGVGVEEGEEAPGVSCAVPGAREFGVERPEPDECGAAGSPDPACGEGGVREDDRLVTGEMPHQVTDRADRGRDVEPSSNGSVGGGEGEPVDTGSGTPAVRAGARVGELCLGGVDRAAA